MTLLIKALFFFFLVVATNVFWLPETTAFVAPSRIQAATRKTVVLAAGPSVLEKPKSIERISETTKQDERHGTEVWEIRLHNDPYNKREFVARCLTTICGKSDTESFQIMMQAHKMGMGIVGRYNLEVAELYYKSLTEHGLLIEMVPVDDE